MTSPPIPIAPSDETYPACKADACGQDSRKCPCPWSCEIPGDELQEPANGIVTALLIALALVGMLCAVSPVLVEYMP